MADTTYPIGLKFIHYADKYNRPYTIVDVLTTKNSKGETVSVSYLVEQAFVNQTVKNSFPASTIARSKIIS